MGVGMAALNTPCGELNMKNIKTAFLSFRNSKNVDMLPGAGQSQRKGRNTLLFVLGALASLLMLLWFSGAFSSSQSVNQGTPSTWNTRVADRAAATRRRHMENARRQAMHKAAEKVDEISKSAAAMGSKQRQAVTNKAKETAKQYNTAFRDQHNAFHEQAKAAGKVKPAMAAKAAFQRSQAKLELDKMRTKRQAPSPPIPKGKAPGRTASVPNMARTVNSGKSLPPVNPVKIKPVSAPKANK